MPSFKEQDNSRVIQILESSVLHRSPSLFYSVHCEESVSFDFGPLSWALIFYFQMVMGYGFFDGYITKKDNDL